MNGISFGKNGENLEGKINVWKIREISDTVFSAYCGVMDFVFGISFGGLLGRCGTQQFS
jgi:hypothetical protein